MSTDETLRYRNHTIVVVCILVIHHRLPPLPSIYTRVAIVIVIVIVILREIDGRKHRHQHRRHRHCRRVDIIISLFVITISHPQFDIVVPPHQSDNLAAI